MAANLQEATLTSQKANRAGAKTNFEPIDGTRTRAREINTIRENKRMELMKSRRKLTEDQEFGGAGDQNNTQQQGAGGGAHAQATTGGTEPTTEPQGRGSHRYHEQLPATEELWQRMPEFINTCGAAGEGQSVDPAQLRFAVRCLRHLICLEETDPVSLFVQNNGIAAMMSLLSCPDESIIYDSVWTLTNVASGDNRAIDAVLDAGVVPRMVTMLVHPTSERIRGQAAWCLGNIVGNGANHRNHCLQNGAMRAVLACADGRTAPDGEPNQYQNGKVDTMRTLAWLMAQLTRFKPVPPMSEIIICLPTVANLLENHPDPEVQENAAWTLSFMTDGMLPRIGDILNHQANAGNRLVGLIDRLFNTQRFDAMLPCLRFFGNMAAIAETADLVFAAGVVPKVRVFLDQSVDTTLRREACWLLANCLAGTPQQSIAVLDANLVPGLVDNINTDDINVAKEAAWAVANLAYNASPDVIRFMVERNETIERLALMLRRGVDRLTSLALETVAPIIHAGQQFRAANGGENPYAQRFRDLGGLEILENLTEHRDAVISAAAAELMYLYYRREVGGDEGFHSNWEHQNDHQQNNNDNNPDQIGVHDFGDGPGAPRGGGGGAGTSGMTAGFGGFGDGRFAVNQQQGQNQ